jgi:hypothetical protein
MTWFDVDGARNYLAQQKGSSLPSRKTIYRMVENCLRVARAEQRADRKRGGTRMFFGPDWIDQFLLNQSVQRNALRPRSRRFKDIEMHRKISGTGPDTHSAAASGQLAAHVREATANLRLALAQYGESAPITCRARAVLQESVRRLYEAGQQPRSLCDEPPSRRVATFDGPTFGAALDANRLGCQLEAVRAWMLAHDGWQTLSEIARGAGYSDAAVVSVSGRLRDLRKPRFGGYTVERRRGAGTWEYRVTRPEESAARVAAIERVQHGRSLGGSA